MFYTKENDDVNKLEMRTVYYRTVLASDNNNKNSNNTRRTRRGGRRILWTTKEDGQEGSVLEEEDSSSFCLFRRLRIKRNANWLNIYTHTLVTLGAAAAEWLVQSIFLGCVSTLVVVDDSPPLVAAPFVPLDGPKLSWSVFSVPPSPFQKN